MATRGREGIPTDRDNTNVLKINTDGSLDVLTRLREIFPTAPGPFPVGLTRTIISPASDNTRIVDVFNYSTDIIYIGFDNTVTIVNGMPIIPYCGKVFSGITSAIYAIAGSAGNDIRVLEAETESEG